MKMNKQEQIEEMANIPHKCIKSSCEECIKNDRKCADYKQAEAIYNAGYRKADEVRKETAKDICDWLEYRFKLYDYVIEKPVKDSIKVIRKKYGVKVKE